MPDPAREKLLGELRMAVAVTRLIQSGDRMLGRGVTPEWERAHTAACDVLDRCEAAGIAEADLDAVIAEGAAERRDQGRADDTGRCWNCGGPGVRCCEFAAGTDPHREGP